MKKNSQQTKVRKTFQLGKCSEVKQRDCIVSLFFEVKGEEIEIEFNVEHLGKVREIVRRLQKVEKRNKKATTVKEGNLTIAIDF